VEWQSYVTGAQNSLRVIAESTGGFAVVNRNDLTAALKQIDADTSDYYMVGYYSDNPDLSKRRPAIQVKVRRPGLHVKHR
jgi:VWFA-related protein